MKQQQRISHFIRVINNSELYKPTAGFKKKKNLFSGGKGASVEICSDLYGRTQHDLQLSDGLFKGVL